MIVSDWVALVLVTLTVVLAVIYPKHLLLEHIPRFIKANFVAIAMWLLVGLVGVVETFWSSSDQLSSRQLEALILSHEVRLAVSVYLLLPVAVAMLVLGVRGYKASRVLLGSWALYPAVTALFYWLNNYVLVQNIA